MVHTSRRHSFPSTLTTTLKSNHLLDLIWYTGHFSNRIGKWSSLLISLSINQSIEYNLGHTIRATLACVHKVKIHVVSTSELHANEVISSIITFLLKLLTLSVYVFKIQPNLWSLRGPWIRTKYCQDLCELSLFLFFYPPIILRNAALTKKMTNSP